MNISDTFPAEKKVLSLAPKINAPDANLVFINCGDFGFLLPGNEIVSLLPIQQFIARPQSVHDCGYVEFDQHIYPVFSFNKALQLQTSMKEAHNALVLLHHRGINFAVSCHDIQRMGDATTNVSSASISPVGTNLIFHKVPTCMKSRKQPFTEFAIINTCAAGLTSASALFTLLRLRGAKLHPQKGAITSVLQGAG